MPDALETMISAVPEDPAADKNLSFSPSAIQERWPERFPENKENSETGEAIVEETKKIVTEEKKTDQNKSDIPDSILGIEETKPKEEEEDVYNLLPKGQIKREHFKKVQEKAKADIAAEKARYEALQKEHEEYRGKYKEDYVPETFKKEYETLKARDEEREQEFRRLNIQHSREFKEKFTNRQDNISKMLKNTAEELEIPQSTIDSLLRASPKRRVEIFSDLDAPIEAKSQIITLLQKNDEVELEKGAFMENWKQEADRMDQERILNEDKRKAQIKELENKDFDLTWDEMSKDFGALQEIKGNDSWNKGIEELRREARAVFDGDFSAKSVARLAIGGLAAQRIYGMFEMARNKVQELHKEVQSLKAANPSAPPPGSKIQAVDDSKLSMEERAKRTFDTIVGAASNNGF